MSSGPLPKPMDMQAQSIIDQHRRSNLQPSSKQEILSLQKLHELVNNIAPNEKLDVDVENVLLQIADEFVDNVATFACAIARHRKSSTLDAKDVQLYLDHSWNIRVPGYTAYSTPLQLDSQRSRMSQLRKMAVQNAASNPRKRKAPVQS